MTVRAVAAVLLLVGSLLAALTGSATATSTPASPLAPASGLPGAAVRIVPALVATCKAAKTSSTAISWTGPAPSSATLTGVPATVIVPRLPPGEYSVTVSCTAPDPDGIREVATQTGAFTVVGSSLALSPASGEPGRPITATGRNFTRKCVPDGTTVRIGGVTVRPTDGPRAGGAGDLSLVFEVPDLGAGAVQVEVACVDGARAVAGFTVLVRAATGDPNTPGGGQGSPGGGGQGNPAGGGQGGTGTPGGGPGTPPGAGAPAAATDPAAPASRRSEFVRSVPLPAQIPWSLSALLVSLALFAFLFWALGFPSEPFNKTLEENRDRLRAWFAHHGDPRRFVPDGWAGVALFSVLAAALLTLAEPGTGTDIASLVAAAPLALGFLVAVPVTTLAYATPAELLARRTADDRAPLRVLPGALVFAAVCVALTRWADLQPGYVYGLFAFYAAVSSPQRQRWSGPGVLLGSGCLLAVSLLAWFAWPAVAASAAAPGASFGVLVLDAALVAVFVLGIQTLAFGLVPLTFLDGLKLKRWNLGVWAVVWAGSLALLVHVHLSRYVREVEDPVVAVRAAVAFLAFGALSAGFWLALRLRRETAEDDGSTDQDEDEAPDADADTDSDTDTDPAIPIPTPDPPGDGAHRRSLIGLALATAVVVLIVAVPATIAVAGTLWRSPVAEKGYPATVVIDALRVRDGPSTGDPRTATVYRGTTVIVRCATDTGADATTDPWHELAEPNSGDYVSDIGLDFGAGPRPPPC